MKFEIFQIDSNYHFKCTFDQLDELTDDSKIQAESSEIAASASIAKCIKNLKYNHSGTILAANEEVAMYAIREFGIGTYTRWFLWGRRIYRVRCLAPFNALRKPIPGDFIFPVGTNKNNKDSDSTSAESKKILLNQHYSWMHLEIGAELASAYNSRIIEFIPVKSDRSAAIQQLLEDLTS